MRFDGEASEAVDGLVHQALIYGSDEEFTNVAAPFVEEAALSGEPALVVVGERNLENLRAALGEPLPGVTLLPVEQWYETSARTREKFGRWVSEHTNGGRARVIAESPWAVGQEAQVRDWARYESVLNIAFAERPVTFICPYDERALPPEIIQHARSTHPEVVGSSGTAPSEQYENPLEFCRRLDTSVSHPAGEPETELTFGLADLHALRQTIRSLAVEAGLPRARADELVLAVHEIATNAVIHGCSPTTLRAWRANRELVFEVSDCGEGIKDALAGQLTPAAAGLGGRGLWLTRLLSDAVEISNGTGCTVAIHATAPTPVFAR
ncbi:MAG TPA: sensor histidine kinase [Solirubrobacterales bacterium]|nr:sensor histidine kinase [Solirubrobacterales bacterium]